MPWNLNLEVDADGLQEESLPDEHIQIIERQSKGSTEQAALIWDAVRDLIEAGAVGSAANDPHALYGVTISGNSLPSEFGGLNSLSISIWHNTVREKAETLAPSAPPEPAKEQTPAPDPQKDESPVRGKEPPTDPITQLLAPDKKAESKQSDEPVKEKQSEPKPASNDRTGGPPPITPRNAPYKPDQAGGMAKGS